MIHFLPIDGTHVRWSHLPVSALEGLEAWWRERLSRTSHDEVYRGYLEGHGFQVPPAQSWATSVAVAAIPCPPRIVPFVLDGRRRTIVLPTAYFATPVDRRGVGEALGAFLGARVEQAPTLPYKLLAAASDLGRYGRNSLIYVEGLGTAHLLAAYWTAAPCAERRDSAVGPGRLTQCERCGTCTKACPTGAIPATWSPIDVDRCVPLWNETDRSLPEHFPPEASHALVGCLACQRPCPANGSYFASAELLPELSEGETRLLLEDWQPALKEVLSRLLSHHDEETLREWAPVLRRNLSAYLQAEARSHPVHHP